MSDGPTKVVGVAGIAPDVEPEPLDDIILGEDDDTVATEQPPVAKPPPKPAPPPPKPPSRSPPPPPVAKGGSVPPVTSAPPLQDVLAKTPLAPPTAPLEPAPSMLDGAEPKKRAKMTLRIPDDEVSRPQLPVAPPSGDLAAAVAAPVSPSAPAPAPAPYVHDSATPEAPPIQPQRIIAAVADDTMEVPAEEVRGRMPAFTNEVGAHALGIDASRDPGWTPYPNGNATIVDPLERLSSPPPASEEIPIDTDDVADPSSEELATTPRLPSDRPSGPDSEEIRVEEGEIADRVSETGEVPEIDPDDLVSVESLPKPGAERAAVATAGKYPAYKPPASAAALIATTPQAPGVAPVGVVGAQAVTPVAPPVATPVATPGPPAVAAPAAMRPPATSSPTLTSGAVMRPPQAGVIVPPSVGALAPPPMSETAAARKKARPWWEELFNDDFIRTMAKVTNAQIKGEVDFIEESLGCEAGAMVLDLACGTGRHAVELAARGYQVVGFDLSLAMLARASDEAQDRKQKINFVQGDMRDMTFEDTFDGVYAWNTSFGYFDEEKNAAVVAKVHKALKKGGQFLLDVVNRDFVIRQAPSLAWFEGDGCICMDEMQIDFITSRMRVKRTMMMDDGRTKEIEYSIRIYALHELGKMLHDNGFRVAEVSGRTATPGVYFGNESPRTLILAEKR